METVQAWLNKVDEEELAGTYFAEFPIDYMMIAERTLTLGEIRDRSKKRFLEFVHQMKKLEIQPNDDPCVFFACKQHSEGRSRVGAAMCRLADIHTDGQPECYSWLFTDFARVMGYLVADTRLTMKNVDYVLAEILNEMSFFGYDQKAMEAEREKLLEADREIEEGKCYPAGEVFERLAAKYGLERREPDPEAEEKEQAIRAAEYEYNAFCQTREIARVRELVYGPDHE